MAKRKAANQHPTWQEQLATVAEATDLQPTNFVQNSAQPKQEAWYSIMSTQELPVCMHLKDAAKLCGVTLATGYYLIDHDWRPFVRRYGDKGVLIRTAALLAWREVVDTK